MYPGYSDAEAWLGRLAVEKGDLKVALRHLQTAAVINSVRTETLLFLGLTFVRLKRDSEAEDVLTKARQIAPNHAEVARDLGIVLHRQGKRHDAVAHLRHALQLMVKRDPKGTVPYDGANKKADHVTLCLASALVAGGSWSAYNEAERLLHKVKTKPTLEAAAVLREHLRPCTALRGGVGGVIDPAVERHACRPMYVELPM